jgi:hypothetical protein
MSSFYGDPGWEHPSQCLFESGGGNKSQRGSIVPVYDKIVPSRTVWKGTMDTVITTGPAFQAVAMGLWNNPILPPWMPYYRCSDNIFGIMLGLTSRNARVGYLPSAVGHFPDPARCNSRADVVQAAGVLRFGNLVAAALSGFALPVGRTSREDGIALLGRHLMSVSELRPAEAVDYVFPFFAANAAADVMKLETLLQQNGGQPEDWAGDVRAYIEQVTSRIKTGRLVFSDLAPTDGESLVTGLRLLRHYGELLVAWPEIVGACRRYRDSFRVSIRV